VQKEVATTVMADIQKINASINDLLSTLDQQGKDEDIRELTQGALRTVMHVYKELMRPVIRQFPDLDPDAEFLSKK
jgi:hypothetical protein